ncbi:hypothetical protein ACFE04_015596 [Oxalis oulophora]
MNKKKLFSAATTAVLFLILVVGIGQVGSLYRTSEAYNMSTKYNHVIISGQNLEILPLIGHAMGPESYTFDHNGRGPYTGVSDGRILKWEEHQRRWIEFATTSPNRDGCEGLHDHQLKEHICGRPMGMGFNKPTGDLYIADAYMGLLKVGPQGGLASQVVTQANGIPLGFSNSLDIDQSNGVVYFTDSSSRFQRRSYIWSLLTHDKSGRLMKYDPRTNQVTVLLENLSIPNGVSISQDGRYLLLVESVTCRVLKYWIKTGKVGSVEIFAKLAGFGDNIKSSPRGGYWVSIPCEKGKLLEWIFSFPWLANTLVKSFDIAKFHSNFMKVHARFSKGKPGIAIRLNEEGEVVETYVNEMGSISEVFERDGYLWIGNVNQLYVSRLKL